jgi:hypothetical protein
MIGHSRTNILDSLNDQLAIPPGVLPGSLLCQQEIDPIFSLKFWGASGFSVGKLMIQFQSLRKPKIE